VHNALTSASLEQRFIVVCVPSLVLKHPSPSYSSSLLVGVPCILFLLLDGDANLTAQLEMQTPQRTAPYRNSLLMMMMMMMTDVPIAPIYGKVCMLSFERSLGTDSQTQQALQNRDRAQAHSNRFDEIDKMYQLGLEESFSLGVQD